MRVGLDHGVCNVASRGSLFRADVLFLPAGDILDLNYTGPYRRIWDVAGATYGIAFGTLLYRVITGLVLSLIEARRKRS